MLRSLWIKISLVFILSFFSWYAYCLAEYDVFAQQVQEISQQLNSSKVDHDELFSIIPKATSLRLNINQCIAYNKKKLDEIDQLLLDKNVEVTLETNQGMRAQLEQQKQEHLVYLGHCKLLYYQIDELLNSAHRLRGNSVLFKLFEKHPWPKSLDLSFNSERLYAASGLDELSSVSTLITSGFVALIALMLCYFIYKIKFTFMSRFPWVEMVQKNLAFFLPLGFMVVYINEMLTDGLMLKAIINDFFVLTSVFLLVRCALMLTVKYEWWRYYTKLKLVFYSMLLFISMCLMAGVPISTGPEFFVSPIYSYFRLDLLLVWVWLLIAAMHWYQASLKNNVRSFLIKYAMLLSTAFLHTCIQELNRYDIISDVTANIFIAVCILIFNFILSWIIWPMIQDEKLNRVTHNFFKFVLICLYAISVLVLAHGYFFLAKNIILNCIVTTVLIRIMYESTHFKEDINQYLATSNAHFLIKVRSNLGLKPDEKPVDIYLFYMVLNMLVLIILISGLFISWGGSFNELNFIVKRVQNGFLFFSVMLYPGRIFQALFIFCCLLPAGRLLATYVSNKPQFSAEKHTRVTMHTFIRYLVFGLACVVAMMVSGVEMGKIALITGALSFGLGFGLQHFASDLVSGLFLLINRPVKIGDHIAVNTEEGFIKKIGLFSTRISTLEQADLIIANSLLITNSVKNFTFENNKSYKAKINVVPVGEVDFTLCQELLLNVAKQNKNVVWNDRIYPVVLFDKSTLTLSCTIINVNKKDIIISELSLEIARAFADNNIQITWEFPHGK